MMGVSGEKDPEMEYVQRLKEVIGEGFEFVSFPGLDHDGLAMSVSWKETILKFLSKVDGGGGSAGGGDQGTSGEMEKQLSRPPEQEKMQGGD